MVNLKLVRYNSQSDYTQGLLFLDCVFECHTLEDEFRLKKVKGETRIWEGTYPITKRRILSPLTQKYRKKFDWFDFHLEINNVPDFKYVYIHIGNDDDDTDACVLVGTRPDSETGKLWNSTAAYKELYKKISAYLDAGEEVFITIETIFL